MKENDGILTLEDENGKILNLRVLELLSCNGQRYVLLEDINEENDESYIFRFIENKEDMEYDSLESIEDKEELLLVCRLFEQKMEGKDQTNKGG
ncbi:MAG: DUF1292 domain-containing protein [Clostridia bacterium]